MSFKYICKFSVWPYRMLIEWAEVLFRVTHIPILADVRQCRFDLHWEKWYSPLMDMDAVFLCALNSLFLSILFWFWVCICFCLEQYFYYYFCSSSCISFRIFISNMMTTEYSSSSHTNFLFGIFPIWNAKKRSDGSLVWHQVDNKDF